MTKKRAKSIEEIEKLVKTYLDNNPDKFFTPRELENELDLMMSTEQKRLRTVLHRFCYESEHDFAYRLAHQYKPEHGYFRKKESKGIYRQTAKAYGRVFPEDGSYKRGIRVFNDYNKGAMDGDEVLIDLKQIYPENKAYASVKKILSPSHNSIAGVLYGNKIYPCDKRITPSSFIAINHDQYDDFDMVEYVLSGEKALIERKICDLDLPFVDILKILDEWNIPVCFDPKSIKEANNCCLSNDYSNREDLRDENVFTIDPVDAKDFDDALSISYSREKIVVKVHIADVSHFVTPEMQLDKDAQNRTESIYTPEGVFPMLPKNLSENVCSLIPNADRLTVTCELNFNLEFEFLDYSFYTSVVNSKFRLNYEEVDRLIESENTTQLCFELKLLNDIAQNLRKKRIDNGALIFEVPSLEIGYKDENLFFDLKKRDNSKSSQLIEELMILTNQCAADFIKTHYGLKKGLYRIHSYPDTHKLWELSFWLEEMGVDFRVTRDNFKDKFNELRNLPYSDEMFLKAMSRAEYSVKSKDHFALSVKLYSHFTSPIRRYSDIIVHRFVKSVITGEKIKLPSKTELERLCKKLNNRTVNNEKAGFAIEKPYHAKIAKIMQKEDRNKVYDATVTAVKYYGVFVRLENGVEGLMHESAFDNEHSPYSNMNQNKEPVRYLEGEHVPVLIGSVLNGKVSFFHRDLDDETFDNYEKFEEEYQRLRREEFILNHPYYDFDEDDFW